MEFEGKLPRRQVFERKQKEKKSLKLLSFCLNLGENPNFNPVTIHGKSLYVNFPVDLEIKGNSMCPDDSFLKTSKLFYCPFLKYYLLIKIY